MNYRNETSLLMAKLSEIAYNLDETKLKELGFSLITQFGVKDSISGYICANSQIAVLVFKGTSTKHEAVIDIQWWHTKQNHLKFAYGFYNAYQTLFPAFSDFLKSNKLPLFITGHSLGGAMAIVAAMNEVCEACYTFGSPRVSEGFGLDKSKSIFRVVHSDDVVPCFPPFIFGYWGSIGKMVYLCNDMVLTGFTAHLVRLFMQFAPIARKMFLEVVDWVKDHFIDGYIKALQTIASKSAK